MALYSSYAGAEERYAGAEEWLGSGCPGSLVSRPACNLGQMGLLADTKRAATLTHANKHTHWLPPMLQAHKVDWLKYHGAE